MISLFPQADGAVGSDDRGYWLTPPFTLDLPGPVAPVAPPAVKAVGVGRTLRRAVGVGSTLRRVRTEGNARV